MHLVDGIPIGGGAYLVYVDRVFEPNAFLWRNQNNWTTLDNALGEIIPWPKEAVTGVLPNGQKVAVKRLSQSSGQGSEEFKNEVMLNVQRRTYKQLLIKLENLSLKLLRDAQFEELSARDLLLTSALNTDYLLMLPIYVDWKKAYESNAIIFSKKKEEKRASALILYIVTDGEKMVDVLVKQNIVPGIEVDKDLTIEVSHCSLAGSLAAVFQGIDANKYCNWCHDINCVPSSFWSCSEKVLPCEMFLLVFAIEIDGCLADSSLSIQSP
ncbi:hypothetical protein Sjap_015261 [Stephania japonica]|uniref:Transposase Tnp1/En/Spm-like domain-containing protein n=1 Tax=Stephania japonica TaxID=461633 RepID=A0AAP0IIT1_9MAGN